MGNKKLEEEAKKRRTDPVYSSTWQNDWEEYVKTMAGKLICPVGKDINISEKKRLVPKKCCSDPEKYKNGMGRLRFWSCKNCGADLGDIND